MGVCPGSDTISPDLSFYLPNKLFEDVSKEWPFPQKGVFVYCLSSRNSGKDRLTGMVV